MKLKLDLRKKKEMSFLSVSLAALAFGVGFQEADRDNDGLPDTWETAGSAPINPAIHGCRPDRADFFFIAVRRPGVTMAEVMPNLEKAKQFFSRLPNRNPDGTTGINMIIIDGGEIPASEATTPYTELYPRRMPAAWRDKGHGYVLEDGDALGGGNTSGQWSGSGYHWSIIVHELGHQFGLSHEAPGSRPGPTYTSLMNYAYSYGFRGSMDNIHFSTGKFLSTPLTETSLNEVMPYSVEDLAHFSESPYDFKLRRRSARETEVDFNRNGTFGERNVRATISDGYAVITTDGNHMGAASGSPTIGVVRNTAYVIWPSQSGDRTTWNTGFQSGGNSLKYVKRTGNTYSAESVLLPGTSVQSPPSATEFKNRLVEAHTIAGRVPIVNVWATEGSSLRRRAAALAPSEHRADQVTLLSYQSPTQPDLDQAWMLAWDKATKRTKIFEIVDTGSEESPRISFKAPVELDFSSDTPPAAVYNRKTSRLVIVGTATREGQPNRLQISEFADANPGWRRTGQRWVGLIGDPIASSQQAVVLLDDGPTGGETGQLRIYYRPNQDANVETVVYRALEIGDRTFHNGWRIKMMRDDWSYSRSMGAFADIGSETMMAIRWSTGELQNRMVIMNDASGISSVPIRDFDDVSHIANVGLKASLNR